MNRCFFTGNLTRDPELRYTPSGKAVAEFSIAVNEGSGEKRTVEFIECQAWEKLAELVAEHCRKGRKVLVVGRYTTDKWVDKNTQQKRERVRMRCMDVEFLDSPRGDRSAPTSEPAAPELADLKF